MQSVAASRGSFATASVSVAPGNGFTGGTIHYPTGTSLGAWGAVAIVPGLADSSGVSYLSRCPYVPPDGGTTPPAQRLVSGGSGRCLDVPGASTTNGTRIQLYACTAAANQRWSQTG